MPRYARSQPVTATTSSMAGQPSFDLSGVLAQVAPLLMPLPSREAKRLMRRHCRSLREAVDASVDMLELRSDKLRKLGRNSMRPGHLVLYAGSTGRAAPKLQGGWRECARWSCVMVQ